MMVEFLTPEDRYNQAQRVNSLADLLSSFLAGKKERVDIERWTRAEWPNTHERGGPFNRHAAAQTIFDSVWNMQERHGDAYLVREEDIAVYLEWLTRGDAFIRAREPLVIVSMPLDALKAATRGQEARMWVDGLGWVVTLRFASAATGRCFMADAPFEGEGAQCSSVYAAHTDDLVEAALDLIEILSLDDSEVQWWLPEIERAKTRRWSLWRQDDNGQRYEIASFLAYSRAMSACTEFEGRRHKQTYWVCEKVKQ